MRHLYKIRAKTGELVTFKPNDIQLAHIAERMAHRYNYIVKYRQGGVTTLYSIDLLDEALWISGMTCAIIAHEAKKLPEYFNIVRRAFINLPEALKPKTKTDTKHMYEFVTRFDGARLDSSIYVATDIRGGTVQNLHVTESAYIKDRLRLKSASKQAVPLTGRISEETTGNGYNEFYDDYMSAYNNHAPSEMEYKAYFYSWIIERSYSLQGELTNITKEEQDIRRIAKEQYGRDVTDGQLLWRRWKAKELMRHREGVGLTGEQLFKQEYPLTVAEAFQSGAGNVFNSEKLDTINPVRPNQLDESAMTGEMALRYKQLIQKGWRFWELPKPNKKYNIGVDPSDGEGSDNSCIDVYENDNIEQVAQFYGKVRPDELAELTKEIAEFYNRAFVGVENNQLTTILFLSKIYDNIYYETKIDEKTMKKSKKLGWNTNTKTRDPMIDEFIIAFDEDTLIIRSNITLNEMRTFVRKENGKREHADGKHDDSLFAAFIALQMRKHNRPRVRTFTTKPF